MPARSGLRPGCTQNLLPVRWTHSFLRGHCYLAETWAAEIAMTSHPSVHRRGARCRPPWLGAASLHLHQSPSLKCADSALPGCDRGLMAAWPQWDPPAGQPAVMVPATTRRPVHRQCLQMRRAELSRQLLGAVRRPHRQLTLCLASPLAGSAPAMACRIARPAFEPCTQRTCACETG